jgi:hypothetical protein
MRDNYVWMECKGSIYTAFSILNPLVQFTLTYVSIYPQIQKMGYIEPFQKFMFLSIKDGRWQI